MSSHRNPQQVIAGLLHQVMQSSAFASKHQNAIAFEVIVGVIGSSTLIQSKNPDMLLLHLLQRPNQVRHPSDPHMLRSPSRRLRNRRSHWSRASFWQNHSINTSPIRSPQQSPKIMRILDAIQSQEKSVFSLSLRSQQILNPQEFTLPNHSQNTLMRICPR